MGGYGAYATSGHVQDRVAKWLDPWASYNDAGYQNAQAQFCALASGGVAGSGLGLR